MLVDRYPKMSLPVCRKRQAGSTRCFEHRAVCWKMTGSTVPRASRLWQTASLYAGAWAELDPGRSAAAHADL